MASAYVSTYPRLSDPTPEERARRATVSYDSAADQYGNEVGNATRARDAALGQANRTRMGADQAVTDYANPGRTPLAGWAPTAMTAYAPTQMAQWMAGASGAPARPALSAPTKIAGAAPVTFDSKNLAGYGDAALENFDPSAAGKTFAGGAYGDFKRNLGTELRNLTNTSVGAGRFRTGLFDEDQGRVVNQLGETFDDKIAQQAGVFSGQRLDALKTGAGYRLQQAGEMDTNARAIAELNANQSLDREKFDVTSGLDRDKLGIEGYGAETDRLRTTGGLAQSADELAYRRASDTDRLTYDQARGLTDVGEARARTGLEASMGRERTYLDEYDKTRGEAASAASGQRDWAARDRELEDLRAEIAAIRGSQGLNKYGVSNAGSAYSTPDSPAVANAKAMARAAGVPYRG